VRRVRHPVAAALVRAAGRPITGTSANLSGAPGCAAVDGIDPFVLEAADLVLDAGPLAGGPGSTVVDVTGTVPVILREGAVPGARILAAFAQIAGG
jgi:L-threonylcarbamoyladenylate synthase